MIFHSCISILKWASICIKATKGRVFHPTKLEGLVNVPGYFQAKLEGHHVTRLFFYIYIYIYIYILYYILYIILYIIFWLYYILLLYFILSYIYIYYYNLWYFDYIIFFIIYYITLYFIISYHIISFHIISYHILYIYIIFMARINRTTQLRKHVQHLYQRLDVFCGVSV